MKDAPTLNGQGLISGEYAIDLNKIALTPSMLTMAQGLIADLDNAKNALDAAQRSANNFLTYCGAELGLAEAEDDWNFDRAQMAFVRGVKDKPQEL